jgi:hypothetical protein
MVVMLGLVRRYRERKIWRGRVFGEIEATGDVGRGRGSDSLVFALAGSEAGGGRRIGET